MLAFRADRPCVIFVPPGNGIHAAIAQLALSARSCRSDVHHRDEDSAHERGG